MLSIKTSISCWTQTTHLLQKVDKKKYLSKNIFFFAKYKHINLSHVQIALQNIHILKWK